SAKIKQIVTEVELERFIPVFYIRGCLVSGDLRVNVIIQPAAKSESKIQSLPTVTGIEQHSPVRAAETAGYCVRRRQYCCWRTGCSASCCSTSACGTTTSGTSSATI